MNATQSDELQQRQQEEDGGREVKYHKRILREVLLVSEAHRIVKTSTYCKPETGGKWPELLDPHCDESTSLKMS